MHMYGVHVWCACVCMCVCACVCMFVCCNTQVYMCDDMGMGMRWWRYGNMLANLEGLSHFIAQGLCSLRFACTWGSMKQYSDALVR